MPIVGISLFLLPPVPGIPIYFMSGMMLLAVCEPTMGLFGGVVYCTFLGLILKLVSGTIQQQIFGKKLGNMVAVRQMVGVNSDLMRAARVVMADPGLTWGKCAILTGGPDWPTFVTTGILGCDFVPVFIGTFPCIVLIIPTVLMGMFVYIEGEPYNVEWARTVGTVATMITGLAQGGVMLLPVFYLEKTQVDRKDEIDVIPLDEEVRMDSERSELPYASLCDKPTPLARCFAPRLTLRFTLRRCLPRTKRSKPRRPCSCRLPSGKSCQQK